MTHTIGLNDLVLEHAGTAISATGEIYDLSTESRLGVRVGSPLGFGVDLYFKAVMKMD